jgi:hypothetical protein
MSIFSVQQQNRSVLHLNHENEESVKQEYTITYIYRVRETMCIYENSVCSETQVVTEAIITLLFHDFF